MRRKPIPEPFIYAACVVIAFLVTLALIGAVNAAPSGAHDQADAPPLTPAAVSTPRAVKKVQPTDTPAIQAVEITPSDVISTDDASAAVYLAKTVWGEARGCSTTEQAAVVWCVLNRVDSPQFPGSVAAVVTAPRQFHGYSAANPVDPALLALAQDVLARWEIERLGVGDPGRVLPADYLFFEGDGTHNYFRTEWTGGKVWGWTLPSPYGGG